MLCNVLKMSVRYACGFSRFLKIETGLNISVRHSSILINRHPIGIENEDEIFDIPLKDRPEILQPHPKGQTKSRRRRKLKEEEEKRNEAEMENDIKEVESDLKGLPVFTKLYENEETLSTMMLKLMSKKKKKKEGIVVLEGFRLIQDAVDAGLELETLVFSRVSDLKRLNVKKKEGLKSFKVPYRTIQLWSTLTTSPGIMGIFRRCDLESKRASKTALPITIICDNVRDPGNMGSILRASAAVGCEKIILTKGCVDIWDTKVLRAASGAVFRFPVYTAKTWPEIFQLINTSADIYVADNNEYRGSAITERQSRKLEIKEMHKIEKEIESIQNNNKNLEEQNEYKEEEKYVDPSILPVVHYYDVDYTKNEIILIIGGETEGLSSECFSFVEEKKGMRVNIPLDHKIESLNTGMAMGIIAFEAKRQFLVRKEKLESELTETKKDLSETEEINKNEDLIVLN